MEKLNIETLRSRLDYITESMSGFMCDCAVYSFHKQNHKSKVRLKIDTANTVYEFEVTWTTEIDKHLIGATEDLERTTEWGAMGIALLAVKKLTGFPYIRSVAKGPGIDFYLSKNDDFLSFDARLEVRGIGRKTASNNIETALKLKKQQTKRSDYTNTPVFISITEFSEPKSLFVQK